MDRPKLTNSNYEAKFFRKAEPEEKIKLTISIKVAHAPSNGKTPQEIMKTAYISLYKAKENGRNCIITS